MYTYEEIVVVFFCGGGGGFACASIPSGSKSLILITIF